MIEPLLIAAATIALIHTVVGVDHYLPFVVLGRARHWSLARVIGVTAVCGVGHVVGSIALGFVGIGLGTAVGGLALVESFRASLAAWGLIAFGLAYVVWALVRMQRKKSHSHVHAHSDGELHTHEHGHQREHLHTHAKAGAATFWGIFIVFVMGPCEPLIPVLMAPAFEQNWGMVVAVTAVFAVTTIGTMVIAAVVGTLGLRLAPLNGVERYANVAAGAAITCSGFAIAFLGI